jgi:predicted O-methyltransferase YrrM
MPSSIKHLLSREVRKLDQERRNEIVSKLPKVSLEEKHISNCELVLDRRTMLQRIGKRGVVAELGVNRGDFSAEILSSTTPEILHLVDIWGTDRYHEGLFDEVKRKFKERIESDVVRIHRKISTDAASDFEDGYFDMVYIDTDHSYSTTRDELLAYSPKMKPDGIIAGHDYSMGNWVKSYRYGVIEAVHEFCAEHDWELLYLTAEPLESQSFAIRRIRHDMGGGA